ncbi:chlorohydrolase [Streptococcus pneumoniae]|nr:chlorohydrolase [Streptococcus pneumoniae]
MKLTKTAQNPVSAVVIELTKSVTYTYGKTKMTWFEEYGTIITYLKILKDYKLLYLDK